MKLQILSTTLLAAGLSCAGAEPTITVPRIWDDAALAEWATPIAALGVRPAHFTSAEYYSVPAKNLRTYPVYRPDREPPGYWQWLQSQTPQPLIDPRRLRTKKDWIKAGEVAFREFTDDVVFAKDPEKIKLVRSLESYNGIWTQKDGTLPFNRWVVTTEGVHLASVACAGCHSQVMADGSILWGASTASTPRGFKSFTPVPRPRGRRGEPASLIAWRNFTVPWKPDPRIEQLRDSEGDALVEQLLASRIPQTFARPHSTPYHPTKTPDLNNLKDSRYLDATATHRLRGPEDVARYAAFVLGADPMEFGSHKILNSAERRVRVRYADEVLYAIGAYLMSLEPPKNPNPAPVETLARGRLIFARENCVNCHVPGNYTSGKLTLALGYTPPPDHPYQPDILPRTVATDPGLAMATRKGTGFYKIPSLRGVWYRAVLLHDGSAASLEEMFDPARLNADHVPGGWKGPGVTHRAIPGHPFGLNLTPQDKDALLAFLRSL